MAGRFCKHRFLFKASECFMYLYLDSEDWLDLGGCQVKTGSL